MGRKQKKNGTASEEKAFRRDLQEEPEELEEWERSVKHELWQIWQKHADFKANVRELAAQQREEGLEALAQQLQAREQSLAGATPLQWREERLQGRLEMLEQLEHRLNAREEVLNQEETSRAAQDLRSKARIKLLEGTLAACTMELKTSVQVLEQGEQAWNHWLQQTNVCLAAVEEELRSAASGFFSGLFANRCDKALFKGLKREVHASSKLKTGSNVMGRLRSQLQSLDALKHENPRVLRVHDFGVGRTAPTWDTWEAALPTAKAHFYGMLCASNAEQRLEDFKEVTDVDIVCIPGVMANFEARLKLETKQLGHRPLIKFGFHGTDDHGLDGILKDGFQVNHPQLGRNGLTYGTGIYLSHRPRLAMGFVRTQGCPKIIMAEYMDVPTARHHRTNEDGGAVVLPEVDLVRPKYVLHIRP
mmetsp:Transcript_14121/g.31966  ORF Transcript_14121/g.31966 Transcript_14121/m.31966 type:complete len:419 (+) Transcript_14121:65-1321(+)